MKSPYRGQGRGPCWTFSTTRCEDLWQPHPLQLIYYSASKRNTTATTKPSKTNAHPHFLTHLSTLALMSIKLILEQGTRFISETNDVVLTNAGFHVSLTNIPCYSTWHFNPETIIPQGNWNDIRVTNTIFPYVYQQGDIMENNVQLPLELIDFWINARKFD